MTTEEKAVRIIVNLCFLFMGLGFTIGAFGLQAGLGLACFAMFIKEPHR